MEFKSLKNIQVGYKQIRLYAIIFAVLCLSICIWTLVSSYNFANRQREKVYILDNGKSLILALSQDVTMNRPVELREHIRRFHELFFTIAPDKYAIEENMKRAFSLCDKTAYEYYKDLAEKGYYNRLISGNVNQRIKIDSIITNMNVYPYEVTTYSKQYLIRKSNITERQLTTHCIVQNTVRSDPNPQGFLMERFEVIDNQEIRQEDRV